MSDPEDFRVVYERHVGYVIAGDMESALADMAPENLETVFAGVTVPRGAVDTGDIVEVRADGERMVGSAVYRSKDLAIGLRSYWIQRDGRWLAVELENFAAEQEQP